MLVFPFLPLFSLAHRLPVLAPLCTAEAWTSGHAGLGITCFPAPGEAGMGNHTGWEHQQPLGLCG